jgi:hypothetical protein
VAVAGGSTLGWVITHRLRGAVAGSVAALLLVFAMAGPVPVGRSLRAFNIFLAVLPAALLGGAALGLFSPAVFALITRGRPPGERAPTS